MLKFCNKKTILTFTNTSFDATGGIERFVIEQSIKLSMDVDRVIIVFMDSVLMIIKGRKKPIKILFMSLLYSIITADLIIIHDPQIYKTYLKYGLFARLIGKEVVLVTHGLFFHTPHNMIVKRILEPLLLWLATRATICLAVGYGDYNRLLRYGTNVLLFGNGIDNPKVASDSHRFDGLKVNDIIEFIYVGRDSYNKRVLLLVEVFACYFLKSFPFARLTLIGPKFTVHTHKLVKKYSKINISVFEGVSDARLMDFMSKSHFLLSASSYEGFGRTVVEAASVGVIPIVNKNPGHNFILKELDIDLSLEYGIESEIENALSHLTDILNNNISNSISVKIQEKAKRFIWEERNELMHAMLSNYRNKKV